MTLALLSRTSPGSSSKGCRMFSIPGTRTPPRSRLIRHPLRRRRPVELKHPSQDWTVQRFGRAFGPCLAYGPRRFLFGQAVAGTAPLRNPAEFFVRTLFNPLAVIDNPSSWLKRAGKENFDAAARALKDLMLMSGDAFMSDGLKRRLPSTSAART